MPLPERERQPLGTPSDESAEQRIQNTDTGSWGLQTAMALGVVILLIVMLRVFLKRMSGGAAASTTGGGLMEVLARCPIGNKAQVVFLRVNQRIIVAAHTQAGMNTLAQVDDPDEVAALLAQAEAGRPASISQSFQKLVRQFEGTHEAADGSGGDADEHLFDRTRSELSGLTGRLRDLTQRRGDRD